MPETQTLSLHEKAALLMLDDVSGRFHLNTDLVLGGIVLAELAWKDRISFDGQRIVRKDSAPTGDELQDQVLAALAAPRAPADAGQFLAGALTYEKVMRGAHLLSAAVPRIASRLVERGILTQHEERLIWSLKYDTFPTADPAPEAELDAGLRRILVEGEPASDEDALLLCLVAETGGLGAFLTRPEVQRARQRLPALRAQTPVIQAVWKAVHWVVGLQMGAAIAAVVIGSSA